MEVHTSGTQGPRFWDVTTIDRGLFYPSASLLQLKAYVDADLAWCSDARRLATGCCMFLGLLSFGGVKSKLWYPNPWLKLNTALCFSTFATSLPHRIMGFWVDPTLLYAMQVPFKLHQIQFSLSGKSTLRATTIWFTSMSSRAGSDYSMSHLKIDWMISSPKPWQRVVMISYWPNWFSLIHIN